MAFLIKRALLSLLLLMATGTVAWAEGETAYAVWCADNTTLYFLGSEASLTAGGAFTPEGTTDPVTITNVWSGTAVTTSADTPAWNGIVKGTLTTVVFEPSFADVQPTKTYRWFQNCSKLTSIQGIGNLNTSAVTTMRSMFEGCSTLPVVDVSSFNTAAVTTMQYMFYGCKALTSLDLSSFNTGNVTTTQEMFNGCTNLQSLNLSGWTNTSLTNLNNMFRSCEKLTTLTLTGFQTPAATNFNSTFAYCKALESIDLSGWNTEKVTDMQYMFYGCTALESVDLSSFSTGALTSTYQMFYNCTALQSVNLSGWTNTKLSNMSSMFYNCTSLTSPVLTDFSTDAVSNMSSMFQNCSSLASLDLSGFSTAALTNTQNMFNGCKALTTVDLSGWTNTKLTNMSYMFSNCTSLTTPVLTDFSTAAVSNMSYMFQNCSSLTSLDLTAFDTTNLAYMGSMFRGCSNLESINLSGWTNEKVIDMSYLFSGCEKLATLNLTDFATPSVTNMSYMFQSCKALTNLDLSGFNTEKVTNMSNMFQGCTALQTLNLSNWNTAKVTNMSQMFYNCGDLESIYVSLSWTTGSATSSGNMFYGCSSLVGEDGTTLASYSPQSLDRTHATDEAGGYLKTGAAIPDLDEPLAYAIWCADNATLYFLQSTKQLVSGRSFTPAGSATPVKMTTVWSGTQVTASGNGNPQWYNTVKAALQHVVFEPSFADVAPASLYAWFRDCANLTDLSGFANLNTANVTNMSYMFSGCAGLQSLNLGSFVTEKVTNMSYMFQNCSSLSNLNIGSFNTAKVNSFSYMFNGCRSLAALDVSHFTTPAIGSMDYMFAGCSGLTTLDLSSFDFSSRNPSLSNMFNGSSQLQSIYVSDKWTLAKRTDANVFKDCTALVGEDGTTYDANAVTAAKAHYGAGGYLRKGTQSAENETATGYAVYCASNTTLYLTTSKRTLLQGGVFRSGNDPYGLVITNLWSGNSAINGSWNSTVKNAVTRVVVEEGYHELKPATTQNWFKGCTQLAAIEGLANLNMSAVTRMDYMFQNCQALTSLDLSTFDTRNVTSMSYLFSGCSSLASIDLSSFNTEKVDYFSGMFEGCSQLQTLDLSSFVMTEAWYTFSMFKGCSQLQSIFVGDGWTVAGVNASNSTDMFAGCTSLPNFDADVVDKTNAHPYEGGYLKEGVSPAFDPTPYIVWNSDSKTFYFLLSTKRLMRGRRFTPAGSDTSVEITELYSGEEITNSGARKPTWLSNSAISQKVEHVVIEPSFIDVHPTSTYGWFSYCYALQDITGLQYLNTSEVTDMRNMFLLSNLLTSLDLRGFNTEKVTTMSGMFQDCSALETLDLSTFHTPELTTMENMFKDCHALKSLDLSGFSNEKLTSFSNMFSRCDALETINMDGFGIGRMTNLNYMFLGCKALRSLDLSTLNTANVTSMNAMFEGCEALETVNLSGLNTERVTTMRWMFHNCNALKSIDLSAFRSPELTDMSCMFENCESLETIDLSGLGQTKVNNIYNLFCGCTSVKTINFSGFGTDAITSTSSLFKDMENLESIDLSSLNLSEVTTMSYMFDQCKKLKTIALTGTTGEVTSMTGMFRGCAALETLDISGLRTSEELRNYDQLFKDCTSLKTVDLTPLSGGRPSSLKEMFYGCSSLETIDVTPLYTGFVQTMEEMFSGCSSLKSVDFSGKSGYNVNDMDFMFEGCTALESVSIDMTNLGYVASRSSNPQVFINGLFKDCASLKSVDLKALRSMTIDSQTKNLMFSGCSSLESLDLSEFYTSRDTGLYGLFAGCSSLKELDLSTFSTDKVEDMECMFQGCSSLESIFIEDGWTTQAVTESADMFSGCTSLVGQDGSSLGSVDATDATRAHANAGGLMRMKSIPYAIYCDGTKTLYLTVRDTKLEEGSTFTPAGSDTPLTVTCLLLKDKVLGYNYYGLLQGNAAQAEKVVIEESFATQCPTSTANWFKGGSKLTTITGLEHLNTSAVTSMQNMFEGCSSLTALDLSTFDVGQVVSTREMFKNCTSLQTINLIFDPDDTDGCTDRLTAMDGMFYGCRNLKTVDLQNFQTSGVESMTNLFYDCRYLQTINFGANWDTRAVEDMSYMFYRCYRLEAIDLSLFDNLNCRNMTAMFMFCSSLTELDMSNFAGYYTKSPFTLTNVNYLFYGCSLLKTIYVGDEWVEHYSDYVNGIGYTMFSECTSLVGGSGVTYDSSNTSSAMANAETGYFTYKGVTLTIPASGVATFSAPYKVVVPEGVSAYVVTDYEGNGSVAKLEGLRSVTLNDTEYTIIPEYVGVLLRGVPGQTVKLIATAKTALPTIIGMQNLLVPVVEAAHVEATFGDNTNFSLDGNKFCRVGDSGIDMPANTAVLQIATTAVQGVDIVWLEALDNLAGDANGDGAVSIADVTAIIGYLTGNTPSDFNKQNANVDGDLDGTGEPNITTADIQGVVNLILNKQ